MLSSVACPALHSLLLELDAICCLILFSEQTLSSINLLKQKSLFS